MDSKKDSYIMLKMNSYYKYIMILFFICSICFFGLTACGESSTSDEVGKTDPIEETVTLSIVDKNATAETKALLSNLWEIQKKGFMFGHHDDLLYGRNWFTELGRSDTKDVVGDYPAVYSLDFAEIMDDRHESSELNDDRKRTIIEAFERGEVITANIHINNPLTGGDSWDNSSNQVVKEILTDGSETNIKYKSWLDRLANFAINLKAHDGTLIPVLFRPYHEHTQTWSWWGKSCTTQDEFIQLWKFTVDYLKEEKGVHNFLYAISPQLDSPGTIDNILFRWPGDDYVDFIGMDSYHGTYQTSLIRNLKNLENLSKQKLKPCGVTETGVEGIRYGDGSAISDYWTQQILLPFLGREVSMVVLWRNKYDPNHTGHHYFSTYQGEATASDFEDLYESSISIFSNDLPNMYEMANGVIVQ